MTTAIKFKNSPLGITANKLNKALLQSGGGGGSGDMSKAVYDANGDGISDHAALADAAPWNGISGKPATFPSDWNTTANKPVLPDPGAWAALSYATGWSQASAANYRIQVIGTIKTVFAQGIIAYASGAASLAFTLPAAARPAVVRGCSLAGYDSTGDVLLFQATIGTDGTVKLMPLVRQGFVWPSATNGNVYLDSLTFSL